MSGWNRLLLDPSYWRPEQRDASHTFTEDLLPGAIVVYDRKAYRLIDTRPRPQELWPDEYRDRWVEAGMPDPASWSGRPIVVVVQPEGDEKADLVHLLGRALHSWDVLPEHYSVCRRCGEIPPCSHTHNEQIMLYAAQRLDREMAIVPGACHGCRGPISARQKTITFEGENLIRPDFGENSAIFHLKQSCRGAAESYDARWAKAGEDRRRKLFCEGRARHHYDGTMDCTDPECPGKVNHRSAEWHRPGYGITSGCWCVSGDLTARIEQQMRDGEVSQ